MPDLDLVHVLFPHFAALVIERIVSAGRVVRVHARVQAATAVCAGCEVESGRVHSRYERRLVDAPVGGRELVVHLRVRRFFCDADGCTRKTFAEQVPGLTVRHGRRTPLVRRIWETAAMALGGRAGARLVERLAAAASRSTLLRLVRAHADPEPGEVRILGVDDFAWRKGHHYGTVLVDLEGVVDVLADRSADTLAAWLEAHPGVEIVCRDRAACYADGASRGAPTATNIADRFHLWRNLCQAVDRAVARLRPQWRSPSPQPPPPAEPAAVVGPAKHEGALAARTRARHSDVHALLATGLPHAQIAERLRLDRKTVRRFARAATPDELINGVPTGRRSSLDRHASYLTARFHAGVTSTRQLHRELRDRGVVVSERTVRRFLIHLRQSRATTDAQRPADPTRREVTRSITSHPDNVNDADKTQLTKLCDRCPDLDTTRELVASFADVLVHRRGGAALEAWAQRAEACALPELRGYATGLRADWDAVTAGVTHAWSSGQVEGQVNRIKMIKRQMYGRANPDLLRTRVLAYH